VLPNHYVFQLAERPPADAAALLAIFRPVPPVVRRRAKELLDTIREAVREALGEGSAPKPVTAAVTVSSTVPAPLAKNQANVAAVAPMEVDSESPAQTASHMWPTGKPLLFAARTITYVQLQPERCLLHLSP
jgi:exosome complex exonuclease RRP6